MSRQGVTLRSSKRALSQDLGIAEVLSNLSIIGEGLSDQIPKPLGVIEFLQVAQLMHDDVVGQFLGD
jgi:hypothetical protein